MPLKSPPRRLALAAAMLAGLPLMAHAAVAGRLRIATSHLPLVVENGGEAPGALNELVAPRGRAFDVHNPAIMKDVRVPLIRGSALKAVLLEMAAATLPSSRGTSLADARHR